MRGTIATFFPMRLLFVATSILLFSASPAFGLANFNGTWTVDLGASSAPDPILKHLGLSWIERQFAGSLQLEATYTQTPQLLTAELRGLGFRRKDVMRIDNKPETNEDPAWGDTPFALFGPIMGQSLSPLFPSRPRTRTMPNLLLFGNWPMGERRSY